MGKVKVEVVAFNKGGGTQRLVDLLSLMPPWSTVQIVFQGYTQTLAKGGKVVGVEYAVG